jgi:hypothetical protein
MKGAKMFDIKLGNMLPEKFYPIIGDITIMDIKTDQIILYGTCTIPRYNLCEYNDFIYVNDDYKLVGHRSKSSVISININDIPLSFKYQIDTVINDEEFNHLCITGLCRGNQEAIITIGENISSPTLIPIKQANVDRNEFKLCDIKVWKE